MNRSTQLFAFCSLLTLGCDGSKKSASESTCVLGAADDPSDVWLLPNTAEARKLDGAIRSRNQGTVNLLLAKYDARSVPAGTACTRLTTEEEFVQVRVEAKKLSGWVPTHQLRGD